MINLPHQVSSILQGKLPTKDRDPGPYNLSVKLGSLEPKGALVDLRASISLMPLSIAKRLPFSLRSSRKTIQLADGSIKVPCGELDDVPIQVGDLVVPCDFLVMDMEKDPYTPLILRRAILKTLRAVINCHDDTIIVEVAQRKVVFKISPIMRKPMVEQVNRIDSIDRDFEEFQREVGIGYSREEEFSLFEEGICEEYVGEEDHESETEGYTSEETELK